MSSTSSVEWGFAEAWTDIPGAGQCVRMMCACVCVCCEVCEHGESLHASNNAPHTTAIGSPPPRHEASCTYLGVQQHRCHHVWPIKHDHMRGVDVTAAPKPDGHVDSLLAARHVRLDQPPTEHGSGLMAGKGGHVSVWAEGA